MTSKRPLRTACLLLSLGTCPVNYSYSHSVHAAEPATTTPLKGAAARRVALWQRSPPITRARYTLTRHTSLLWDPLVVHGTLTLTPALLELRDDERTGATTRISPTNCEISANDATLPPDPAVQISPAITWLHDHLVALLSARDPEAILKDAKISVPRGAGSQLDLNPSRSHPAHAAIDHLRVRLDPETGEILELELLLTAGDRIILALTDPQRPPV